MNTYSRRDFAKLALAALPAAGALSSLASAASPAKPDSRVNGVHIGLNVPYSFGNPLLTGDEILANCVQLGVSAVELRTQPVEAFLGVPAGLVPARGAAVASADAAANAKKLADWRAGVPMAKAAEFRKKYETAGVFIDVIKVDGIFRMSDAELDYAFNLARALGARAISTEISKVDAEHERVGRFADKHRILLALHGHATTTGAGYEKPYSISKFVGSNLDIGHYVAGENGSPVEFIKRHHERIPHVHIKDRKRNNGKNFPFGEGDTPVVEVLRLIRDNKFNIQATIEFEYPVPPGSTRMAEIAKAVAYCRQALA